MGAEVTVWVEVERIERVWVESYGVTGDDAIDNVLGKVNGRVTGNFTYERPEETKDEDTGVRHRE